MHRRALVIVLGCVGMLALATMGVILTLKSAWAADYVEQRARAFLEARLDGKVDIGTISLQLYPELAVSGTQFHLIRNDSPDGQPFVSIAGFQISGSPWQLFRRHVSAIELEGLDFRVLRGGSKMSVSRPKGDILVDRIVVRNGRLLIVPSNPQKVPLDFALHEVTLTDFGFDRSSAYAAQITNPKPTALIQAEGHLGPWDGESLSTTPVSGVYLLANGDLGSIKGIGGGLQSTGKFDGVLERIRVEGTTTSKDFQLMLAEHPVPLTTAYVAVVDGTTGDTTLERVDAVLGESHLSASGSIASTPGRPGRSISLQVTATDARFEDLLRLAIGGAAPPPMRGRLNLNTRFVLPPSNEDIPLRLLLDGRFAIARGQFTSDTVQDRIDELSRRGRGQPNNEDVNNVLSTFGGRFTLRHGVLSLPQLQFAVNGAAVDLNGAYTLPTEALDFHGTLSLDAPVSKTVTGFRSLLLKAVDPLFRRNGKGTVLPIAITGSVQQPSFKVEPRRIFRRN